MYKKINREGIYKLQFVNWNFPNNLLHSAHCRLRIVHCPLRIAHCLLPIAFFLSFIVSCKSNTTETVSGDPDIYYTCSMDPQVVEAKPGKCPICRMDLTPVKKSSRKNNDELALSPEQMHLGNIRVDTIRNQILGDQMILTGILNFDQTKVNEVSARVDGRIEKLYFRTQGAYVAKGTPLYEIYSEELNNAKQEYLLALQKKETLGNSTVNYDDLIAAAKSKLLLWGLSEQQIENINKNNLGNTLTTFYSTASGYITRMNVQEGDYVTEGGNIVTLAEMSTLWAEAQVYVTQLPQLDNAKGVIVEIPEIPGKKIPGKISFRNPEINALSKINLLRIEIHNSDNRLKPGMAARITIKTGGNKALFLPSDAVLRDGNMTMVWVQTSQNHFKMAVVETGTESGNMIEIKSGIQQGDKVVISGAYLLSSEYIFRKGTDAIHSMDMGGMKMEAL